MPMHLQTAQEKLLVEGYAMPQQEQTAVLLHVRIPVRLCNSSDWQCQPSIEELQQRM